jgi:sulfotransferase
MQHFVFLSGLPRSGSTLLTSILSQNPKIHAEGNSAVCQLMNDMIYSCVVNSSQQLRANNREITTRQDLVCQIPHTYYKNITETIVVDKCRSWTLPANVEIIKQYITPNFKIIVLERPVLEIVKSFVKLYSDNNKYIVNVEEFLAPNSEPIMRSIVGVTWAKQHNEDNNFLFLSYYDLINNPEETIRKIYDFCAWEYFPHDFTNIVTKYPENDAVYDLNGHHHVRPTIKKNDYDVVLPPEVFEKCKLIDRLMGYSE